MTNEAIIKAWKNEQYRHTLSISEQAQLPAHPVGLVELDDSILTGVSGAEEEFQNPTVIVWICGLSTVTLAVCVSMLVGTCSPGGSMGCCKE